jgi:uncharacterized repeat protein (TIGR01451 family)
MAGKMRIAAKLLLGATVLASGGGGGYYYTQHGWHLPASFASEQKPVVATADLDSVASAWAEPTSPRAVADSLSSPVARSATPVTMAPVKPIQGDRYATIAETAANEAEKDKPETDPLVVKTESVTSEKADVDEPIVAIQEAPTSDETAASDEPEPTPADIEPVALASHAEAAEDVKSTSDAVAPVAVAAVATEAALARGQEPKEDASTRLSDKASDAGTAIDALTGDIKPLTEPKPLNVPARQATGLKDTSQNARQAFGAPATGTAADRYSNSAPSPREAQPQASNGAAVNPFAMKPAAAPINSRSDTIAPLPAPSNDVGDRLTSLPENPNGLRPLQGDDSGNSFNRDTPRAPISPPLPRENSVNPYNRSLPPANQLPRNTIGSTPLPTSDGTGKPGEKALEGPQQPTLVIQKFAPGEIQVGKTAKFVLQIRNAGNQAADGVLVRDEVPQGTKLISTSPNATTEGSHIVWQIGKLSPGEDRTVEMQLMPTAEGEIGSVATVSYTAQASVKTKCTMPQLAIRMTAPSEVMIGSQQHVKIEIKNPGTGDATKVMLFENVPSNVKHVAGPALEFEIGTLRAGETRELDLVLTAEKAGKVVNALTAKAEGNLQVQQQVEFEVIAPGLSIALDGPERRYLERPATYEVSVENPGTAAAHDVQIVTKLPKGMRFVRANNMGEYDAATHAVYWSLAELPKGERGSVELVAMPTETGPQTLQVEGHAQQGLADHKQRDIMVEGLAALMFEVKDLEDPIEVGGETGYEIRVVNQGTKAATNVQIAVDLPPGLKVISAEGESAHKIQDGRLTFEPLEQLAPKADTVYKIRAQGLQPGDQRITVQVNTDDMEHPIRKEESTRVFGDQ